ncbi:MAG: gas vesicle protein GvpN [Actinomycetota bacterium]
MATVLKARPKGFVNTPAVEGITVRALRYLRAGFGVHLRGPAGTGKTSLALHLADLLARPVVLIFGDDQLKSSDMMGNQSGYTRKKVVDNFIHSVVKLEDELRQNWVDSRLTLACREGFTLVYDEFNRSRPEVNNVLLSALEEKLLVLPPNGHHAEYIKVNPNFRAIFTSNSEEYCGVHSTQDALMDRLVTINMPEPDPETQREILVQKVGIEREWAERIVQFVKGFRARTKVDKASGLRASLMIAKVCQENAIAVAASSQDFRNVCEDVLLSRSGKPIEEALSLLDELYQELSASWPVFEKVVLMSQTEVSGNETTTEPNPTAIAPTDPEDENQPETTLATDREESSKIEKIEVISPKEEISQPVPVTFEPEVYTYLRQSQGARVSEIEAALGINRVQAIDALRSLIKKGVLKQRQDRLFVAQGEDSL